MHLQAPPPKKKLLPSSTGDIKQNRINLYRVKTHQFMLMVEVVLVLPWPYALTLPWPSLDIALTLPWPSIDFTLNLFLTLPWCYLDLALPFHYPCFAISLTLPWTCLDLASTLPRPCFELALTLPWPCLLSLVQILSVTAEILLICTNVTMTVGICYRCSYEYIFKVSSKSGQ